MMTRDAILAALRLAERDVESIPLGGTLRIRELTRAQWRACTEAAKSDEEGMILIDPWYRHLFAAGVVGEDGAPLFTAADVDNFPHRDDVWAEVARIAKEVLALSEVGADALDKSD